MSKLSDLYAGTKAALKSAKDKIVQEAGLFKEWIKDVAAKYGEDQGFIGNLGSAAADLVTGWKNVPSLVQTTQAETPRSRLSDILGTAIASPYAVSSGIETATNPNKTTAQKIEGVTTAWLWAITSTGIPLLYKAAYDVLAPTEAKKFLNDSVGKLTNDVSAYGQSKWFKKEDTDAVANIAQQLLSIVLTKGGSWAGWKVAAKVGGTTGKVAWVTADMAAQSLQDIIPMAYNYYSTEKDKPDFMGEAALTSLAMSVPFTGFKGKKWAPSPDQTKMQLDTAVSEAPVKEKKLSDIVEAPVKEKKTKKKAAKLSETFTPEPVKEEPDVIIPIDETIQPLEPVKSWGEEIIIPPMEPVVPPKKWKKAKNIDFEPIEVTQEKQNPTPPPVKKAAENINKVRETNEIKEPSFSLALSAKKDEASFFDKARGIFNANFNFGSFMRNIIIKDEKWNYVNMDSHMDQSRRGIKQEIASGIVEPIKEWAKVVDMEFDATPETLIGGVTPEGVVITPENVGSFMQTFKDIPKENLWKDNIDMGMKRWADVNAEHKLTQMSYVYDLIKWDQKKLSQTFTPEQIAFFKNLEEVETRMYDSIGQKLVADGFFSDKDMAINYIRFVMGRLGYERTRKFIGKEDSYPLKMGDGSVKEFSSMEDLLAYKRFAQKRGIALAPDAEQLNSLAKSKSGPQFEPFRTHWSVARILSYGDSVGKMYSDDYVGTIVDRLSTSSDPVVRAYADQLLKTSSHGNFVEEMFGILEKPDLVSKTGNVSSALAMFYNLPSLGSQAISTIPKAVGFMVQGLINSTTGKKGTWLEAAGKVFNTLFTEGILKSREVKNTLQKEWFTTGYELMAGEDGIINQWVSIGSGTPVENVFKSAFSLTLMSQELTKRGIKVGNAESIVRSWNEFKQSDPAGYRSAHQEILNTTKFISDVSTNAKMRTYGIRKIAGPLKAYTLSQVKGIVDDVGQMIDDTMKSDSKFKTALTSGSTQRTVNRVASFAVGMAMAYGVYSQVEEGEIKDEQMKEWRARFGYDPLSMTMNLMGPNTALSIPFNMLSDVAQMSVDMGRASNKDQFMQAFVTGLSKTLANTGVGRSLDAAGMATTGETTTNNLQETAGLMPTGDMTSFGLAKWYKTGDDALVFGEAIWKALGHNPDRIKETIARDKIDGIGAFDIWSTLTAEKVLRNTPGLNVVTPAILDLAGSLSSYDQRMKWVYAYDAVESLNSPDVKTTADWLGANNIPGKYEEAFRLKVQKMYLSMNKENIGVANTFKIDALGTKPLTEVMSKMKESIPALYNDTIGLVAAMSQEANKNEWSLSLDNLLKNYNASSAQMDAAISAFYKEDALKTSLSNVLSQKLYKVTEQVNNMDPNNPDDNAKMKEILGDINTTYEFFLANGDNLDTYIESVSLVGVDAKNLFDKLSATGILGTYPTLKRIMEIWLKLRGMDTKPTTIWTDTAQGEALPAPVTSWAPKLSEMTPLSAGEIRVQPKFEKVKPTWEWPWLNLQAPTSTPLPQLQMKKLSDLI